MAHFAQAVAAGIKTIRIFCGLVMEYSFDKWFGLESTPEDWAFVGTGNDLVALTALGDLGMFTLAAALLSVNNATNFPDSIEICSDLRTITEYARLFENIIGRKVDLQFQQLEQIRKEYAENPGNINHSKLVKILIAEGAYDYSGTNGGKSVLDPKIRDWKLRTAEEFLQEIRPKYIS